MYPPLSFRGQEKPLLNLDLRALPTLNSVADLSVSQSGWIPGLFVGFLQNTQDPARPTMSELGTRPRIAFLTSPVCEAVAQHVGIQV